VSASAPIDEERARQLLGYEPAIVAGANLAYIKLNFSTACLVPLVLGQPGQPAASFIH
jgi:hypothetical protein